MILLKSLPTKKLAIAITINLIILLQSCHTFPSTNERSKKVTSNFFDSTFFKSSSPSRATTTSKPSSSPKELTIEDVPMENSQLLFGDVYLPKSFKMNSNLRNAMSFDDWLWPKGIIPVVIDKKLERHRKLIIESFNHYHQKTCLRFKERTSERDYVKFIYDEG